VKARSASLLAVAGLAMPLLVVLIVLGASGASGASRPVATCTVFGGSSNGSGAAASAVPLGGDELANAQVIVGVGMRLGMPVQAAAIAIMTAQQESGLLNLDHVIWS